MYTAHPSALLSKDNLFRSQVPTRAFTLACTSDQFRSSCRSGPNHTPRMRTGPSLQRKGSGRVSLPVQAPSRKPLLLSKLTFAPAIRLCPVTAFYTASMSRRRDTKTMMSSANAKTLAKRGPAKGTPRRAGFAPSSLSLRSRSSKGRTYRRGDRGHPCQTNRSIANATERLPFTCTTAWGLWFIMLIHLRNSDLNLAVSKTDAKNR